MLKTLKKQLLSLGLLAAGLGGMLVMAALKEEIPRSLPQAPPLSVRVMEAVPMDLTVALKGYGEVQVLNALSLSTEVKGRVAYVNPRLEPGESLSKGELLFQIDETRYRHKVQEQEADRKRLENRIKALEIQQATDLARHKIAIRNQELARAEYLRISRLFDNQVGSRSQMETAERELNRARDLAAELSGRVKGFVYSLNQEKSSLDQTLARLASAQEDLKQCRVHAPFDARVKTTSVEIGQYVMPGQQMVLLADESILELNVNLDSQEALEWLPMDPEPGKTWFTGLKQARCRVFWTESRENQWQKARVHRLVEFNPKTRAFVLAVRIRNEEASGFSIAQGMFCRVEIQGRTRKNIFCLPGSAVGTDNSVFLAEKGRVKKIRVGVTRIEKEKVYVEKGITPGDLVILTPLSSGSQDLPLIITSQKGEKNET